jgi:L-fuconolactonase
MMRIDSHQHFWRYEPAQYPWIRADWPLRRDFLPEDLAPLLRAAKLDGCVAVQARQTLEETAWLLGLATQHAFIKGVVGWVDLRSENLTEQLGSFANNPKFVGVRHVVQDEPDNNFMLRPKFVRGIAELQFFDLAYDLLIYPHQLPAAIQLVRKFPRQRFVLDHIAKPYIRRKEPWPWAGHIRELAQSPNVFCKVSGMVTEADWRTWKKSDFRPYLNVVFEAFTPRRIMYGSDWPVCLLSASYERVYDLAASYCQNLSSAEQKRVFGATATEFYWLGPDLI